jgi:hypothetical protein
MAKNRLFRAPIAPPEFLVYELVETFNERAFLDDHFEIPTTSLGFFLFEGNFRRSLGASFYLEDVLIDGKIGQKKSHIEIKPVRLFLLTKSITDQWSKTFWILLPEKLRELNLNYQRVFGEIQYRIDQPKDFLSMMEQWKGSLGSCEKLRDFEKFLTQRINEQLIETIKKKPSSNTLDWIKVTQEVLLGLKQKLNKYGVEIQQLVVQTK